MIKNLTKIAKINLISFKRLFSNQGLTSIKYQFSSQIQNKKEQTPIAKWQIDPQKTLTRYKKKKTVYQDPYKQQWITEEEEDLYKFMKLPKPGEPDPNRIQRKK